MVRRGAFPPFTIRGNENIEGLLAQEVGIDSCRVGGRGVKGRWQFETRVLIPESHTDDAVEALETVPHNLICSLLNTSKLENRDRAHAMSAPTNGLPRISITRSSVRDSSTIRLPLSET